MWCGPSTNKASLSESRNVAPPDLTATLCLLVFIRGIKTYCFGEKKYIDSWVWIRLIGKMFPHFHIWLMSLTAKLFHTNVITRWRWSPDCVFYNYCRQTGERGLSCGIAISLVCHKDSPRRKFLLRPVLARKSFRGSAKLMKCDGWK